MGNSVSASLSNVFDSQISYRHTPRSKTELYLLGRRLSICILVMDNITIVLAGGFVCLASSCPWVFTVSLADIDATEQCCQLFLYSTNT